MGMCDEIYFFGQMRDWDFFIIIISNGGICWKFELFEESFNVRDLNVNQ
jgi:hypothetical protein